jgi:S1-C subfamily serine protease
LKLADANEGPSRTGFAPVVKKVLPDVVNISSSKVVKTRTAFEGQIPEEFRQFFGDDSQNRRGTPRQQGEQREQGSARA